MKHTLRAFFSILGCAVLLDAQAQCSLSVSATDTVVCTGDTVTVTASVTPPSTPHNLPTTMNGGNNHRGNMFNLMATNTIVIDSFSAHPIGNTTIEVYYRTTPYNGFTSNSSGWILLGSAAVVAQSFGTPTPVPIPVNVTIPAGQTYGFYVTSSNVNVSLNYSDGNSEGAPFASDANITFYEGVGMEYPFTNGGGVFTPRIWNGIIHYSVPTVPVISYLWNTGDTTASISYPVNTPVQYTLEVNVTGCSVLHDTMDVMVSVPPVFAGNDTAVCAGSSLVLSGSGAVSYTWDNGVSNGVSFIPGSSADYVVTGTDTIGCTASDTITVTVSTVSAGVSVSDSTLTADAAGAAYQWIDCSTQMPIPGATGQNYTALVNGSYAVIVTENSCTDTSACIDIANLFNAPAGWQQHLNMYPNPSNGNFVIDAGPAYQGLFVDIMDVTGRIIRKNVPVTSPQMSFRLGEETGIYFAVIHDQDMRRFVLTLIIE